MNSAYTEIVIDAANNLYVNATAGVLYSFDATGRQRWTSPNQTGELMLGTGDELFVADSSGDLVTLSALDTTSGSTIWSRSLEATIGPWFSVLLTAGKHLVFCSRDNVVTAISAGQEPSVDAQWPTVNGAPGQRRAALGR